MVGLSWLASKIRQKMRAAAQYPLCLAVAFACHTAAVRVAGGLRGSSEVRYHVRHGYSTTAGRAADE